MSKNLRRTWLLSARPVRHPIPNRSTLTTMPSASPSRQKTICSLGDLSPRPCEEWLKLAHKLEHALAGQRDLLGRDLELDGLVAKLPSRRAPLGQPPTPRAPPSRRAAEPPR